MPQMKIDDTYKQCGMINDFFDFVTYARDQLTFLVFLICVTFSLEKKSLHNTSSLFPLLVNSTEEITHTRHCPCQPKTISFDYK